MYSVPAAQLFPFPSWRQTVVFSPIVTFLLEPSGSTQPPQPTTVGSGVDGARVGDLVGFCAFAVRRDTVRASTANSNTLTADDCTVMLTGRLEECMMLRREVVCNKGEESVW
jgi:hypothetical protein